MSKHGITGITKAFANELACKNIQINTSAGYKDSKYGTNKGR